MFCNWRPSSFCNKKQKEDKMTNNYNPKIYIACIARYNNGILYGKWIDANQDVSDLEKKCRIF